jgi:CDP-diacylglycerol---serine O-phosphatidyltransferase
MAWARSSVVRTPKITGTPVADPASRIPAAACVAGGVWFLPSLGLHYPATVLPVFALTLGVSVLMVSNISYYSFKDVDLASGKVPFTYAILIPAAFILIALSPSKVLFLLFFTYALSGPALALWRRRRRRLVQAAGDHDD